MNYITRGRILLFSVCFNLFFWCEGCVVVDTSVEAGFKQSQIVGIQPGKTTRQEILELFGPPAAIAKQDGKFISGVSASKNNSEEFSSQAFFNKFSESTRSGDHYMIYYYAHVKGTITAQELQPTEAELYTDKLWVLINQESNLVEDHVFIKEVETIKHPYFDKP